MNVENPLHVNYKLQFALPSSTSQYVQIRVLLCLFVCLSSFGFMKIIALDTAVKKEPSVRSINNVDLRYSFSGFVSVF